MVKGALSLSRVIKDCDPNLMGLAKWVKYEGRQMRAVVQRVKRARVEVEGRTAGEIGPGLLVFLGVGEEDTEKDCDYLANKIAHLRIFPDDQGLMNLSLTEMEGAVLVVSQFTLWGDCRKGRRPSFTRAAKP